MFALCSYFVWLALQNFLLPWGYRQALLPVIWLTGLMAAKEVILLAAILILSFRIWHSGIKTWRWIASDGFAIAYVGLLTAYLFFPGAVGSQASFSLRLISLRSLLSLGLFYFWGRLCFFSIRQLRHFILFVVVLQTGVAAVGVFERFALRDAFWSDTVGIGSFMIDVKGLLEGQNVINGLPSNMFRMGLRRTISTYGDPLAMGIASVFPFLLCVTSMLHSPRSRHRLAWQAMAILIGTALVLTLGRESIGAAVVGVLLLLVWGGRVRGYAVAILFSGLLLLVLPQLWSFTAQTLSFREESAATHLNFLAAGWREAPQMLRGKGLGEAGGWAYSLAGVRTDTGESSYFDLMAQTGLASVLLLLGFLLTTARHAFQEARIFKDEMLSAALLAAAAHILCRSLLAVFSPSLFGVVPLASFFFFCGSSFTTLQHARAHPLCRARRVLVLRRPSPHAMPATSI